MDSPEKPPYPTAVLTTPTATKPIGKPQRLDSILDIHLNPLLNGLSNVSPLNVLFPSLSSLLPSLLLLVSSFLFLSSSAPLSFLCSFGTSNRGVRADGVYEDEDEENVWCLGCN